MRRNKKGQALATGALVLIAIALLGMAAVSFGFISKDNLSIGGGTGEVSLGGTCPDDGDTTLTINVQNPVNTTGSDTFDATYYLRGANGDFQTGTDTTDGSDTINCGEEYSFELVRQNSDGGDHSRVESVLIGPGATIENGIVKFTPTSSAYSLRVAA